MITTVQNYEAIRSVLKKAHKLNPQRGNQTDSTYPKTVG